MQNPKLPESVEPLAPFDKAVSAARLLSLRWQGGQHGADLPPEHRPCTADEGRAAQALWAGLLVDRIAGWKIAATSLAGQQHIAVNGPLAGPVFHKHVFRHGAVISLAANAMRVAECEIVFGMGRTLAPREQPYTRAEVLAAVQSLHPGIEVPDSRFKQFETAGMAQLIADCACTNDMLVGVAVAPDERVQALPSLVVKAQISDGRQPQGQGSNVLGDPVQALCWLVNELRATGRTLAAGQFVTTGACVTPIPVLPGQQMEADFGWLGRIAARFV